MRCVSALSTEQDPATALRSVLERLSEQLRGEPADLVLIFGSKHHAEALGDIAEAFRSRSLARHVLGCTGESIVGEDREVEGTPALSVWALRMPGAVLRPRRLEYPESESSEAFADGPTSLILLGDPFTFPADQALKSWDGRYPGLRVIGGMASGGSGPGENRLVLDGEVFEDGAVAIEVGGPMVLRTVVSQGCRPIGSPMIVTKVERNVIRELGRRPALEVLRELFQALSPEDQDRVQQGLHVGRVINEYQETFRRGDFLVRNVLGADEAGGIAITDLVRVGQTVQFHVRDADTADEDLRGLLERERHDRPDGRVRGALLFSCNGRGSRLFPLPNHDLRLIHEVFGPIPVAGFFAMGELGPVGGQNFVHGYTASVVLFEEREQGPDE